MKAIANITFLSHEQIDKQKWDACIDEAGGLIYGYSFYLNRMAKHWDALVVYDQDGHTYRAVMPLTWNRKLSITYLYQPFLTPQGGVFAHRPSPSLVESFLEEVRARYRFAEINLNILDRVDGSITGLKQCSVYQLSLRGDFSSIAAGFNSNLQRNYRKALAAGCEYKNSIKLESALRLAGVQLKEYTRLQRGDMSLFAQLCETLLVEGNAEVVGVYKGVRLLSAAIFFRRGNVTYYILAGNNKEGKSLGSSHLLLQEYIREHAGQDLMLDFVGSDIRSIAFFYECFGAKPVHYFSYRFNDLPRGIRWLKK